MSSAPDRHSLILLAQTGDPVAISRLLSHCQPDVRRYARQNCHLSNIDDAVQESMLIVVRRIHTLKSIAAFSSWLFRIIKRECQRLLMRFNATDTISDESIDEFLVHKSHDELRIDLIAALESLPAHYLEIILLRDFEELSISEISAQLGEHIPAVKSRLHRARELVREYLSVH